MPKENISTLHIYFDVRSKLYICMKRVLKENQNIPEKQR